MDEFEIVLPQAALTDYDSEDLVSNLLRGLTKVLQEKLGGDYGFGLGGQYGYGVDFENSTFMMHHYCWCEKEDCPWCSGCTCPEDSWHYLIDNIEVSFDNWLNYFKDNVPPTSNPNWERIAEDTNKHRREVHTPTCKFCLEGLYPDKGTVPGRSAPNFWHKSSNLKIWWHKWIGRNMEISNPNKVDIQTALTECLLSLQ